VKSEWWDRRLRLNASGFFSRYRNMQINFLIGGSVGDTKVLNAGRAQLSGLELETTLRLTPELTLSMDYAYLDAEVIEVIDRRDGSNIASRYPFVTAPRHSGVLAADWLFARTSWGELRSYVTLNAIDHRKGLNQPGREGNTRLPGYALVNARVSAGNIAVGRTASLDLAFTGRNLLDRDVPIVAIEAVPQADRAVIFNEPRTLGMEMILRF
jgi:iron complex outermembrane recepter protein